MYISSINDVIRSLYILIHSSILFIVALYGGVRAVRFMYHYRFQVLILFYNKCSTVDLLAAHKICIRYPL